MSLKDDKERGFKAVDELKARNLRWIPFTLVDSDRSFSSWGEQMDFLDASGFECVERELVPTPDEAAVQTAIDRWTGRVTDGENPYPVDGLVVAYDDVAYSRTGSVTGHHATRAGLAFKWQDEVAETELERVEWSCAVASIAPVAVFKPVQLEGTTVRRASLCNVSECERLGVGGVGTAISVIKANKIIPKVVAVTKKAGELEVPATCPVCGSATEVRLSAAGTKTLRCTNAECAARELRKFMKFVSKDGMDVDGLAGETLAKFVNRGWIKTFADIYRLGAHADEIAAMEGFGEKSAAKIRDSVEAARRRDPVHFMVALSIPLCGGDVAKRLLGAYGSVPAIFAAAENAARPEDLFSGGDDVFASIDGIGPAKSAAFVEWCRRPEHVKVVEDLLGEVELADFAAPSADGRCAGLTFVITGDVHSFANRAEFKAYVEAEGGKVAGSVSRSTDFLVNNDVASASGKNKKAKELGIPVISEDEFISRYGAAS